MTHSSFRAASLLAVSLLSSLAVLSACGSSSNANGESAKSASQIFSDAKHATESASSVHISGHIVSGKDTIDLDFVDSSVRSGGTISDNGATFQLILAGKTVYLMGSAETMTKLAGDPAAGQLLGGKWLQTSKDNKDFGSLAELFNLTKLVSSIQPKGALQKGRTGSVDGQPTVAITDKTRKGTLYVANSGTPYIVELVGGNGESGSVKFTDYRTAKPPAIPTGAVNLDQLEGGSAT